MKTERLDIRITKEQKEIIKYAFEISLKKNMSDFIIDIITKKSNNIITENNKIQKIIDNKKHFIGILSLSL